MALMVGASIERAIDTLNDLGVTEHVGKDIVEPRFSLLVESLSHHFSKEKMVLNALRLSLTYLVGNQLTLLELRRLVWRLAGNSRRVMCGHAVFPWQQQCGDEIVPAQIIRVEPTTYKKQPGFRAHFFVLGGSPAGEYFSRAWSDRFARVLADRLGFSTPWGSRPYSSWRQFVDMRLSAKLTPHSCRERLDLAEIECSEQGLVTPGSFVKHNQKLLLDRDRDREGATTVCPRNFPADYQCHTCFVGKEECVLSVHARTYISKRCDGCQEVQWFDPARLSENWCVRCLDRQARFVPEQQPEGGSGS